MGSRTHLTIAEKNDVRRYYATRRNVPQTELLEWVRAQFGKTIGRSTLGNILREPVETHFDESKSKKRLPLHAAVDAALLAFVDAAPDKTALTDDVLWAHAKRVQYVSPSWIQRFKKRHGLVRKPAQSSVSASSSVPPQLPLPSAQSHDSESESESSDHARLRERSEQERGTATHSDHTPRERSEDSEHDSTSEQWHFDRRTRPLPPMTADDASATAQHATVETSVATAEGDWTSAAGAKRQAVDIQTKQQVIAWIANEGGGVPSRAAAHFRALGWHLDPGVFRRWWRQRDEIMASDASKKRLKGGGRKRLSDGGISHSLLSPAPSSSLVSARVLVSVPTVGTATDSNTRPAATAVCNPSATPTSSSVRIQSASATTVAARVATALVTGTSASATTSVAVVDQAPSASPPPPQQQRERHQPPLLNLHERAQKRQRTRTTTTSATTRTTSTRTTTGTMNQYIDHTLLKADALPSQVRALCEEAAEHAFCSVCVNASYASFAREVLDEIAASKRATAAHVKVCCTVGFPLGATTSAVKAFEARECLAAGAEEIDMVINVGRLVAGEFDYVLRDICAVVAECKARKAVSKVILETALLSPEQITKASELAIAAGADFIKTSTGFSTRGASEQDVALMAAVAAPAGKHVKASGGIRSAHDAQKMIALGATRLGTSAGVKIVQGETSESAY